MDQMTAPYKGDGPYVFANYSHKDEEKVLPIIRQLQQMGIRIWWDYGLQPGMMWADTIEEHLSNCSAVVAFISSAYAASRTCADEILYALSLRKRIVCVYLEECVLTTGLAMQLMTVQSLFLWKFNRDDEFYDRLAGLLSDCRNERLGMDFGNRFTAVNIAKKRLLNTVEGDSIPLNEMKVVFLGDGEAGKTYTISRLLNDGGEPKGYTNTSTPGIVIEDKEYRIDGQKVHIHFWDFGGQEVLHTMHRIFLTERTLYVVLLNARDETQDSRARYWLRNIQSFAPNAPVVLVLNKMDQNPNAALNERELFAKYPGLRKVIKLSALMDSGEEFRHKLLDELLEQTKLAGILEHQWPAAWLRVKKELENMQSDFIYGNAYREICRRCGAEEDAEDLLHWFNDLGISFCCCDDYRLDNYVILRPDWITNAIYIMLFNACAGAKNGLLPHKGICRLLKPGFLERNSIRSVLPGVTYDYNEVMFVLNVIRKFQLSFEGKEEHEFIPMLCQKDSLPVAEEYAGDPEALEFRMEFEYLPNNVLHRLMVERQRELDMDQVWLTGALFRQEGTGLSAVVTIDDDVLRILVRKGDPMHRPNTYLSMLISNVERICAVMNLQMPVKQVVYKLEGKQAEFELEDLTVMLEAGEREIFSKVWKRRLKIWDIMNQSAPAASGEEQLLLDRVVAACRMLQADRNYWDTKENTRNTFLRNALRMAGYVIHDQTLLGQSASGKSEGEIDLDIRRYESVPWSICEALRIYDGSKTDWNKHLLKLLDNYNPGGVGYMFLVAYVDCEKERFGDICASFEKHIPNTDARKFTVVPGSWERLEAYETDTHFLRAGKCRYSCGDYSPAVYHIFVRMGE